ncbi:MAG: AraC family transcriptional regulator [Limnochordia bacterium]|nr:AraC family transcriptional regulator [Limnochordia bacterium]
MGNVVHVQERSWSAYHTAAGVARSLFYYVEAGGHFWADARYCTKRQDLNSMLLVYTLTGKGYLEYRGSSYTLTEGYGFLINCMDEQVYYTDTKELWEILWVHFNGSESAGYVERIYETLGPLFYAPQSSVVPTNIRSIHTLLNARDPRLDIQGSCLIVQILTELLLRTFAKDDGSTLPPLVESVINKLENEYNNPLSLDNLARGVGVSKYHLSRIFKKHTGFSPYEYLLNYRLTRGKTLLQHTDLPVEEIAYRVGFSSSSHFIRMFRKYEEMTPLQFRKRSM